MPGVWLVTGASSGFGTAIAEVALRAGATVIATARHVGKAAKASPQIESLGGKWLQLDVDEPSTTQKVDQAIRDAGGIDVIVNNAGYGFCGALESMR
jgi:NAD(P)-dependent dehydrogenase (short-subunit alcohol dehydrogenase family)